MPAIHYILKDGTTRTIDAPIGRSVMELAILNNVRGIDGECGGSCSCATCHVYVDAAFIDLLPAPDEMEAGLLEGVASERQAGSRLSCQITVSAAIDGLVVRVPASQA